LVIKRVLGWFRAVSGVVWLPLPKQLPRSRVRVGGCGFAVIDIRPDIRQHHVIHYVLAFAFGYDHDAKRLRVYNP
jgi:hypothetical protein